MKLSKLYLVIFLTHTLILAQSSEEVVDEKKQSVKFDEKQPFPQFSLNVSNPISWKLMLLIMLMQLLTNMMLVVVLYLK